MSELRYRLRFNGVTDDHSVNEAKAKLATLLDKDKSFVDRLFADGSYTFTESPNRDVVAQLATKLLQCGIQTAIDELTEVEETEDDAVDEEPTEPVAKVPDLSATARGRHLKQLTQLPTTAASTAAEDSGWRGRFRYRFDSFMARGGSSIFKVLTAVFIITFLVVGLARGVVLWLFPDIPLQHEGLGVLGNLYITFLEITDPGNMAQDIASSPWYKVFAVVAGIAGIIMLSALIAFITTTLDQKISELKRGRSKVIETDHTLILGWNEQRIVEVLRELILANESEPDGCAVILADKDKEEMDDALRLRVKDRKTTRIVSRRGSVSTLSNLDMVSLETAKSVIILASCDDTDNAERKAASDAKAIQTILATMGRRSDQHDVSIVVEIFNPTYRDIVRSSFPDNVVTVNTSDVLAKLLVQTSRSEGLSVVYSEMLSFDGCELYFHNDKWDNAAFGRIGYRFPDGVPIGVRNADGTLMINPPVEYTMKDDDEILIVADDDSTIELLDKPVAEPTAMPLPDRRREQKIERELMIGWNHKAPIIVREFADYILADSKIHILLRKPTTSQRNEIETLNRELDEIEVRLIEKDCLVLDELMSVQPFQYDNIIILAGGDPDDTIDVGQVDSENIVALLLLRRIFSQYPMESENTKLITEILHSQNHALVARAGVKDVIISNRLVSMIMAQISENAAIEKVYDDIFQEDGSEIYLKPTTLYFDNLPVDVKFADLMALAQQRGENCIGIRKKAGENNPHENNGVTLIPEKNIVFNLLAEDSLVVVAEDEL